MCGIAGILRRDGSPASASEVAAMAASMAHRGPQGRSVWSDGEVALGHCRLAVRDLGPAAAQPMVAPGGEGALVYNGELYEEGDLRRELERAGVRFGGTGDAEVVLHACARLGPVAAARRFDGMFAFAWWDARERALWLVRDRFGIKPLHVVVDGARVAFGSEVRALRAVGAGGRPDALEIVRHFLAWRVDARATPFEGVENVAPGEAWRIDARGVEKTTWGDVLAEVDARRIVAAAGERPAAWVERVRGALERAVASHLVSDVPVAAFTSSGTDGNAVAAIAAESRPRLPAYVADTVHPESEADAAERIAARTGLDLVRVRIDRETHLRLWPEAIEALEHPTSHPSQPEMLAICRAARRDGRVVVLTGEGSDEVFGGYSFFEETWDRWRRARSRWRSRRRLDALAEAPFDYQAARRSPDLHRRLGVALLPGEDERARDLLARLAAVEPPEDRAFLAHGLDSLRRHLGGILLRHDRLGMAASLELRVPFLSRPVTDVGLHLPRRAKLHRGRGKWALREAVRSRLPAEAVEGKKRGFPIPDDHHRGATALLRGGFVAAQFRWPASAADALVARLEADPVLRSQAVNLELWGRIFVRGERASELGERLVALAG